MLRVMEIADPSSRSPQALRGAPLRDALRELGNGNDTPQPQSAVVPRAQVASRAPSLFVPEPLGDEDDDEPAPRALRPHELANSFPRSE